VIHLPRLNSSYGSAVFRLFQRRNPLSIPQLDNELIIHTLKRGSNHAPFIERYYPKFDLDLTTSRNLLIEQLEQDINVRKANLKFSRNLIISWVPLVLATHLALPALCETTPEDYTPDGICGVQGRTAQNFTILISMFAVYSIWEYKGNQDAIHYLNQMLIWLKDDPLNNEPNLEHPTKLLDYIHPVLNYIQSLRPAHTQPYEDGSDDETELLQLPSV